ncbi:MAG: hypothetical protein Q9228_007111 [Teloschistes exilis]
MAMVEEKTIQPSATEEKSPVPSFSDEAPSPELGVNVSGHKQELQRNFGLLSLCGMGLTSGNVWMALGGTIVRFTVQHLPMLPSCLPWALPQTVAIYNGGPPGVIYEYIAASVFYWIIGASIAELASAIPSSGGGKKTLGPHFHTLDQAEKETSLPLGYHHCWTIWARLRLVRRLVELPGVASRARCTTANRGRAISLHVRGHARRLRDGTVAGVRHLHNSCLDRLLHRPVHEQGPSVHSDVRRLPRHRWGVCDYRIVCGIAACHP